MMKKVAGLGAAFAAAVVLFSAFAASASAQAPGYTAYGVGGAALAGQTVGANIGGKSCGEVKADAQGNWGPLTIASDNACAPKDGDTIAFTVGGKAATETVKWSAGGAPADAAKGITLTVDATAPAPAKTGNAGLLGTSGTSMVLVALLGVAAAAMVAGARTATRES